MKIIFLKAGKFRDAIDVVVVTEKDVENGKVFEFDAEKAVYYEKSGCAEFPKVPVKKKPDVDEFKEEPAKKKAPAKKK
jgi:protein required for attachment to host cells